MSRSFFLYILAGQSAATYVGVTNDLARRVREHKLKLVPGFTAKYNISKLVYFEIFADPRDAIAREKESRAGGGRRKWR